MDSAVDWKTILAPFVGGAAGLGAAHGLDLSPEWQLSATIALAGLCNALAHLYDVKKRGAVTIAAPIVQPPASSSGAPSTKQGGRSSTVLLGYLVISAACVLSACQSLGLATPQTFNQKLAVGYGSATTVLTITDTLLKAGKLTAKQAGNLEAQDGNLKAALDIAATAYASNQADGNNQLATALTALNALSNYLATVH